jgi:SAM-dependent methyltransferase
MFFRDLARATAEFARVLKPGGRVWASVWGGPEQNPWTTITLQAIASEAPLAAPDPDWVEYILLRRRGLRQCAVRGAGLRDVTEWDVEVNLVTQSHEQYWEAMKRTRAARHYGAPARSTDRRASGSETAASPR